MLLLVLFAVKLLHSQLAMAAPLMLNYGQTCNPTSNTTFACVSPYQCDHLLKRCECPPGHYAHNNFTCHERILPGGHCEPVVIDARQCVANAFCNSTSRTHHNCSCLPGYFVSSSANACVTSLLKVGSPCNQNSSGECEPPAFCNTSDTCDCPEDHFNYRGKCSLRIYPHSECSTSNQCVENALCVNILTAKVCLCVKDHFSNGSHCSHVLHANESCNIKITDTQQCTDHAHCDSHSSHCLCDIGFFQNNNICSPTVQAGKPCNNSIHNVLQCTSHSECIFNNTRNTSTCTCQEGWYFNKSGTCYKKLAPMEECSSGDICIDNATCTKGICICKTGSFLNKGACQAVLNAGDPCIPSVLDPHQCPIHSHCATHGSTSVCACEDGYYKNGIHCELAKKAGEPCNHNLAAVCVANADCNSTQNSYACLCRSDYYINRGICATRIPPMARCDLAIHDPKQCVENATCDTNLHVCTCTKGLVANLLKGVCEDMSQVPCNSQAGGAILFDGCPAHAHCVSGKCECEDGYERNAQSYLCQRKTRPIKAGVVCNYPNDTCVSNANCTTVDSLDVCQCNNGTYNKFGECFKRVTNYGICLHSVLDPLQCVDGAQCTNGHCMCLASHYVDHPSDLCYPRIQVGSNCSSSLNSDQCVSNASCTHDVCVCNDGYFNDSGYCFKQYTLGTHCDPNINGQCGGYDMAACDAIHRVCTCGAGYYLADDGHCIRRRHLGEHCDSQSQDTEQCNKHGYCSLHGRCECLDGFFNNTGTCSERVELGEPCNLAANTLQCLDDNAQCSGAPPVCNCKTGFSQRPNRADCTTSAP